MGDRMIYFTSDQHFGHENLIKYCARPFSSAEEMDEEMIKRWNEVIKPLDQVYHLGDFTLGEDIHKYIRRLNGSIRFITSDFHHDSRWIKANPDIETKPILFITSNNVNIMLCHYPMAVWERSHYGAWHLYGHVHRTGFHVPGFTMNVGVDFHGFYPVSFDEVADFMVEIGWHKDWKAEYIK
jgi:calcineurin-like phosphoesterase family protein